MRNHWQIILLIAWWVGACASPPSQFTKVSQGVIGQVLWSQGNLMPSMDSPSKNKPSPVVREIYFCKPVKESELEGNGPIFTSLKDRLVTQVTSNEQGKFAVELPEGIYSVFTKEEGGYFANIFDGQGIINPVEVKSQEVTSFDININYQASY